MGTGMANRLWMDQHSLSYNLIFNFIMFLYHKEVRMAQVKLGARVVN
jgi:hypothetical protein